MAGLGSLPGRVGSRHALTPIPESLHDWSGGNPFFLTQAVHLLLRAGFLGSVARDPTEILVDARRETAITAQIEGLPERPPPLVAAP